MQNQTTEFDYSLSQSFWVGGEFYVPNQSTGYHGLLKQYWDRYKSDICSWLLISEKNLVKEHFRAEYPNDVFYTLEYYAEKHEVDFQYDLCDRNLPKDLPKFDLAVCQATLEHVYDPFSSVLNMISLLNKNGILTIHTHTPPFPYHQVPRDYFRFQPDWFLDIPKLIPGVELLDLYENKQYGHIFSAYRKI